MANSARKSAFFGVAASFSLLSFYFAVLILLSGKEFAFSQFKENWYWIIGLALGFGIQIGIFSYLKAASAGAGAGKVAAVSGTTSGAAMISCCSHYLVNFLPFLGIAGFATMLGQYQTEFFIIGATFNLFGVFYLAAQLKNLKTQ